MKGVAALARVEDRLRPEHVVRLFGSRAAPSPQTSIRQEQKNTAMQQSGNIAKKMVPSARIERAILSLHTEVILVIRFTTKPRGQKQEMVTISWKKTAIENI